MTNYQRGDRFEKRVADDLRTNGYLVWQSRGSKTAVDIVAIKRGQVLLVQAKGGLTPPTGAEWNTLYRLALHVDAVPLIADRERRGVIRYRRITHPHTDRKHDWPAMVWTPDEAELAAAIARHPAGKRGD